MLKRWLMGLLMDEAGGGDGGGGGGADLSPSLDSTSTALVPMGDQSVATTDADEAADDTSAESTEVTQVSRAVENGKWTKPATQALSTIKTSHPKLYQQLQRDRGIVERLYSTVPPGVNPFDAIKSTQRIMKELGGEQGIAQIRHSLAEMEQLDLWYADGDSRFLDHITGAAGDPKDAPFSQSAFVKIIPQAVARLEKMPGGPKAIVDLAPAIESMHSRLAPKSFQRGLANRIINDLTRNDVDLHFRRLAELVPADNAIGKTSIAAIQKYFDDRSALANVEPEALPDAVINREKDPRSEELDRKERDFETRQKQAEIQNWAAQQNADIKAIFQKAMTQHGSKLSEGAKETVMLAVNARMQQAFRNVAGYEDQRKGYFHSNDRAGYLRYMRGLSETHIPRLVKAEIGKLVPGTTPKSGTPPAPGGGTPRTQPQQGFVRVAKMPEHAQIDRKQTDLSMFKEGRAVLKDGKRVQWK